MNDEYQKCILNLAHERLPYKRKPKYGHEYFLKMFTHVLTDVTSYSALNRLLNYKHKYHHKYINQVFNKWTTLNIFKDAYDICVNEYISQNINKNSIVETYIDTTNINNKNGRELINYGSNKKKKICKLSIISDKNIPLQINLYNGNIFDGNTTENEINNLANKLSYKKLIVCGDKGYINNDLKNKLLERKINLITPYRKNQKNKNTKNEKDVLKNRYNVEHMNNILKKHSRISERKDHKISTFLSYVYIALIKLIHKYI
jgi:transposase